MKTRLDLQEELEGLLGSKNVYYQPPPNVQIEYPAIVYSRAVIDDKFANNNKYKEDDQFRIIYIDKIPDREPFYKLRKFHNSKFERLYVANNLNHYSFTIYYN